MSVPRSIALRALTLCVVVVASLPLGAVDRLSAAGIDHLVVSEVMTGGTSASDELIELYNPSTVPLPLEGLELVYVTASGATVSRRAAWDLGAPQMAPGSHLLVANELGIFAPVADAVYASGMAATGGSVALRIQGASTAVDAVGWGSAASTWLEGTPASAPSAGTSLERLPGGEAGSMVDTDDNSADFTTRSTPDPQNSGSPPVPDPAAPSASASPVPTVTPVPMPTPTPAPTGTPDPTGTPGPTATAPPEAIPIATARALPDGTRVTVAGDALTGSDFTDGGGYLADASGGIAILLEGGSFARGDRLLVSGTLDDRFAQRTIRADPGDVVVTGSVGDPEPVATTTGSVDEAIEGRLVRTSGAIDGSPTTLTGGLAFDVDDGSGPVRVLVGSGTGIDTAGWTNGTGLVVVGVAGQRDSSGTGSSGYRVQPRDAADVELGAAPTPSSSSGPDPTPTPTVSPPDAGVVSIADARAATRNARVTVRGVVTLASGTVDSGSAVIQDASGAILLRLGDEAGPVSRGELLEVAGTRSTKGGMETLRVSTTPRRLGAAADPSPRALRSGDAGESTEAQLIVVRGSVVASARRASSGTVSFEIDDGSGPLRVVLGAELAADDDAYDAGTWVEARGVLGQETTGAQPLRGYRIWPRATDDLRVLAAPGGAEADGGGGTAGADGGGSAAPVPLGAVDGAGLADLRVGATLVASAWPELGVAGLLWDGTRLVGIAPSSGPQVERLLGGRVTPVAVELGGLRALAGEPRPGIALVRLGSDPADASRGSAPPDPPSTSLPGPGDPPAWVSIVGRVTGDRRLAIEVDGRPVAIERACRRDESLPLGATALVGVALADPARIVVACDGARPAPVLLRGAGAAAGSPAHASALDATLTAGATPGGNRPLAAGLLAIGVAILALAAVVVRRVGRHLPDEAAPDEDVTAPGPQLTLVRMPNEHGPVSERGRRILPRVHARGGALVRAEPGRRTADREPSVPHWPRAGRARRVRPAGWGSRARREGRVALGCDRARAEQSRDHDGHRHVPRHADQLHVDRDGHGQRRDRARRGDGDHRATDLHPCRIVWGAPTGDRPRRPHRVDRRGPAREHDRLLRPPRIPGDRAP